MKRELRTNLCGLLLLVLMLLLPACALKPVASQVPPVQNPQLPSEAKQPQLPVWCSPTCSDGLTKRRANWQQHLTKRELPVSDASAPIKP